jgi:general secretion pathway protein E
MAAGNENADAADADPVVYRIDPDEISVAGGVALAATLENSVAPDADAIAKVTAERFGVPYLDSLADELPSAEFVERVPIAFARKNLVLGLTSRGERHPVVLGSIAAWKQLDVITRYLGFSFEPCFAPRQQVLAAINVAYQQQDGKTQKLIDTFDGNRLLQEIQNLPAREDLLDSSDRAPVIKLVNMLMADAVTGLASDIHIQPYEERLIIRMRIDGVLFDTAEIPKHLQEEVISRIKVIGRMNIAEKRLPQDGRATVHVGDRLIDLRIASMPTSHGERVVVRLLDKSARLYTLNELGMDGDSFAQFRELIHLEHGMMLVTGPTGSGKSTTLYAALREINTTDRNVLTLEDPIEYQLDGISQTQINTKKGMTFAAGLRSVLRQDPDIIMVGEIRDEETAVMAIQSALTGHLVFSTLHTNDAASAVTRLLDLGIEPYLVASSVAAVLAQRLVRSNCGQCVRSYEPTADELLRLGLQGMSRSSEDDRSLARLENATFKQGTGCETCRHTGYRGRLGIFELLVVNDTVRSQVQDRANATQIRDSALANGMRLLREDGIAKACAGKTTLDEVLRVTVRATM